MNIIMNYVLYNLLIIYNIYIYIYENYQIQDVSLIVSKIHSVSEVLSKAVSVTENNYTI
jgi:hypothetical protein